MTDLAMDTTPTTVTDTADVQTGPSKYSLSSYQTWENNYYTNQKQNIADQKQGIADQKRDGLTKVLQDFGLSDLVTSVTSQDSYKSASSADQTKMLLAQFSSAIQTDSRLKPMFDMETSASSSTTTPLKNFVSDTSGVIDDAFLKAAKKISDNLANFGNTDSTKSLDAVNQVLTKENQVLANENQGLADEKSYRSIAAAYDVLATVLPTDAAALEADGTKNTEQRMNALLLKFRDSLKSVPVSVPPSAINLFVQQDPPQLNSVTLNAMTALVNQNNGTNGSLFGSKDVLAGDLKTISDQLIASKPSLATQQGWESRYYDGNNETAIEAAYNASGLKDRLTALQATASFQNGGADQKLSLIVNDFAAYASTLALSNTPGAIQFFIQDNKTNPGKVTDSFVTALNAVVAQKSIGQDATTASAGSDAVNAVRKNLASEKDYSGQQSALTVLSKLFPDASTAIDQNPDLVNTYNKVSSLLKTLQTNLAAASDTANSQVFAQFLKENPPSLDAVAVDAIDHYISLRSPSTTAQYQTDIATMRTTRT